MIYKSNQFISFFLNLNWSQFNSFFFESQNCRWIFSFFPLKLTNFALVNRKIEWICRFDSILTIYEFMLRELIHLRMRQIVNWFFFVFHFWREQEKAWARVPKSFLLQSALLVSRPIYFSSMTYWILCCTNYQFTHWKQECLHLEITNKCRLLIFEGKLHFPTSR